MDKREGIGLPSSLVNDAIGSMNGDSQKATNNPIEDFGSDDFDNIDSYEEGNFREDLDVRRGSNVDRPSVVDSMSSFNSGLMGDVRGSLNPGLKSNSVVAEPVGQIDYIKWFSELTNKDVSSAGGKGASLGEMFSHKFPVPPGYVITAQAYDYYLKSAGLKDKIQDIIDNVDVDDTAALNEASKKIRKLIEEGKVPNDLKEEILESYKILSSEDLGDVGRGVHHDAISILRNSQEPIFVSVRSSATTEDLADASFAGQQESFLNVKGDERLIEHVKRCFSSLYTPRAIFYRKKKGFSGALIAVVVQKMVDSEKSGVVFSRDPVRMEDNIAMEAVFGLGEGIVSGRIHPDNYVIDRDLEIKSVIVADKKIAIVRTASGNNEVVRLSDAKSNSQVMSRGEIKQVADFAMKLEEHYGKPQDIEFALEAGEVYIIQSRPITTLASKKEAGELKGNVILKGLAASPGVGVGTVRVVKSMDDLVNIKKGDVMVTEMTNPDMVVSMQKSVAIVTDEGGMTSHAAIVSREMGIPAIVGTSTATKVLKDGMKVTVDGFNGQVFEGAVAESTMAEVKKAVETQRIKLKVIVDLPDFAERAAESGIDSVGLTRLEGMIASMGKHPLWYEKQGKLDEYSKILEEGIAKIAKPFKSVWIRASDIRTDEYGSLEGAPEREINPMLGFHGVRFSLKHPEILKAELMAIKEVAEKNPDKHLGLMFPQIISIEEVLAAKKYFEEFKTDNMEFGVMVETPAAVQIIEDICEHVDFISFGTNDLTQYTLAVDRGEDNVQYLYNEMHPAIFSQIGHVIDVCKKKGVVTSICGQAGSKKEMAEFLFHRGISSISVNADAAFKISDLISGLEKVHPLEEIKEKVSEFVQEVKEVFVHEKPSIQEEVKRGAIEPIEVKHESPKPVVQVSDSRESSGMSEEERIAWKKKKKREKFKKWKERKKAEKAAKRKEVEINVKTEGENSGWGKQGEVALPDAPEIEPAAKEDIEHKIVEDRSQFDREVKEQSPYRDNLLNPENIEVGAEMGGVVDEDIVHPVDDMSHIRETADEIKKDILEEKKEASEERHRIEDRIEVEVASPNEIKEDNQEMSVKEKIEEYRNDDIDEKYTEQYVKEGSGGNSASEDYVDLGVYNPESDSDNKSKYNYNFDDFE